MGDSRCSFNFLIFVKNVLFRAIILVLYMLERQSRTQETKIIVWFPQKKTELKNRSLDWRPGSGKFGQRCKKCPYVDATNRKPKLKSNHLLVFLSETIRRAERVNGVNSSLAVAAGDLWPKKCRPQQWLARALNGCTKHDVQVLKNSVIEIHVFVENACDVWITHSTFYNSFY